MLRFGIRRWNILLEIISKSNIQAIMGRKGGDECDYGINEIQPRALLLVLDGRFVSNLSQILLFRTLVRLLTIPPELKLIRDQ